MLPTVAEVLALPAVASGQPEVVAGANGLGREVRWVHVAEVPDIAKLLTGGELILTTGMGWPTGPKAFAVYVEQLHAAGVSAIVLELGRRFEVVPPEVIRAAAAVDLPVVALHRVVRFVDITEVVHRRILSAQDALLSFSLDAHRAFTALSIEGAEVKDVLDRASSMAGTAVVLEDLAHRAVAFAGAPGAAPELLRDWEARSRASDARAETWLVVPVGPRHRRWGRLVMPRPVGDAEQLLMLLERAAEALALIRLAERDRAGLEQQAHGGLLADLLRGVGDDPSAVARAEALGFPVPGQAFSGVCVSSRSGGRLDPVEMESRARGLAEAVTDGCRAVGVAALVSPAPVGDVLLLVGVPRGRSLDVALAELAEAVDGQLQARAWDEPHVVAVGRRVLALRDARWSLEEARHVAEVLAATPRTPHRPFHRLEDLGLSGLLATVRDDPRWVSFAEAQLGPLLAHDARRGGDLERTLLQLIEVGGNKSALARARHLSRPATYARLDAIERLLGIDLDDASALGALHVALLLRALRAVDTRPEEIGPRVR